MELQPELKETADIAEAKPEQSQQQQPPAVHPILRKKPHTDGVPNHHVRIVPAPTACDGVPDGAADDEDEAEPPADRENPFRPGSDLEREADSLLRNSRISRNSVHLPQTATPMVDAVATTPVADAPDGDPSIREDTVSLLTPSTAVAAVIPDDGDSGQEGDAEESLPTTSAVSIDANGSALAGAKDAEVVAKVATSSAASAPTKAEAVQLKGSRACCDLM